MPVLLLPQFIVDLQTCEDADFARRILKNTILRNGDFRNDGDDHRYHGVAGAWIRYVSRGKSAYRVIFIRSGTNIYLYRAGKHAIEERLGAPRDEAFDAALSLAEAEPHVARVIDEIPIQPTEAPAELAANRFLRNNPSQDINRAIFSRRNLPHRDIWLVTPFVTPELLLPTAKFGKMLFDQAEDGASIVLITKLPKNQNIKWLEQLEERNVSVFIYPRLHSKLYCFVLDENRKYARGLPDPAKLSSLLLLGSANMTAAGLALSRDKWNEELCYLVPDSEIGHIETYVAELTMHGYALKEVRSLLARGQLQRLENNKW